MRRLHCARVYINTPSAANGRMSHDDDDTEAIEVLITGESTSAYSTVGMERDEEAVALLGGNGADETGDSATLQNQLCPILPCLLVLLAAMLVALWMLRALLLKTPAVHHAQ